MVVGRQKYRMQMKIENEIPSQNERFEPEARIGNFITLLPKLLGEV